MNKVLFTLIVVVFSFSSIFSQNLSVTNCDTDVLNEYILKEVNRYRKKAKVAPLYNEPLLNSAAKDHSDYMSEKDMITHFQKNKFKKTPKNRVDFYGEQFQLVGENVQQTWLEIKDGHKINNCEDLARVLVDGWRNSPPHYENMIRESYTTTYTAVNINSEGKIYACQLFGSDAYKNTFKDSVLTFKYKPDNEKRCRRCETKLIVGTLEVINDSLIVYSGMAGPLWWFNTKYELRRPRFNWFDYALAADIVLKEQYDCDTNIVFNGKTGVRGIPLEPIFKKDFRKGRNIFFWKFIRIELGTVPDWIDQDYEVNLTVINNKRTCIPIIYNVLPTEFEVDVSMNLYLDSLSRFYQRPISDSFAYKINFDKSMSTIDDSVLNPIQDYINLNFDYIDKIVINGKASIEGTTEGNRELYENRANLIKDKIFQMGVDSSQVSVNSEENFEDFRKSLLGSEFEFLLEKENDAIKNELNMGLATDLEHLLKNQRFAQIKIYTHRYETKSLKKDEVYRLLKYYQDSQRLDSLKKMQSIEYNLALKGEITADDIRGFKISNEKQYVDLLCDRYYMLYLIDTNNTNRVSEFKDSLNSLKQIAPKNERVNTQLELLRYPDWINLKFRKARKQFDILVSNNMIDTEIKARMILNAAAYLDWRLYRRGENDFFYSSVKRFIEPAKLNTHETFELATYYTFFGDYQFAFQLTKKVILKNPSAAEAVFFLKLIYYLDESLSEKTILKFFKRIARLKGAEFCTYFNSPNLNFQILDDPEIRKIYCETCSN